jgi:hypothetical protein
MDVAQVGIRLLPRAVHQSLTGRDGETQFFKFTNFIKHLSSAVNFLYISTGSCLQLSPTLPIVAPRLSEEVELI